MSPPVVMAMGNPSFTDDFLSYKPPFMGKGSVHWNPVPRHQAIFPTQFNFDQSTVRALGSLGNTAPRWRSGPNERVNTC